MRSINNPTDNLDQQAANENADSLSGALLKKEDKTPVGVHTVQGEVLRMERNNYLVRTYIGDVIHLYLDDNSQVIWTVRPGDRIVAMVDDLGHVLMIQPDQ